jgi:microcystin-dependent protein
MYSSANPGGALNPAVMSNNGGNQPHVNLQPFLTLNFSIALQGIFPSQN